MRTNLLVALGRRILSFPKQVWWNLGTNRKYRIPSAVGYTIGAVSALYSFLSLFYRINIDIQQLLWLPFYEFFSDQVLPFLAAPLLYVGLNLSAPWQALLAISSIGGATMANAEFRSKLRLSKHISSEKESGPDFSPESFKNPVMPEPSKHSLWSRAAVFGATLLLAYSFVGLLGFTAFLAFGIYFFYRDVVYFLAFLCSNLLYIFEHFLAPYERWGEDEYWGTRWFLTFFTRRQKLDKFVERSYIEFWRVDSLDPKQRHWTAAKKLVHDGARVVAITLWLLIIVAMFSDIFGKPQ